MSTPEARARVQIDALLAAAGWIVQHRDDMNLGAALGVAVREYPLPAGPCDYLLFIDRKACGVIEAKPEGVTLTGVAEQADDYMAALPPHLQSWADNLLFDYESTGTETLFRDLRDPQPRSRHVFAFHRPHTLFESLKQGSTLRARLLQLPPVDRAGLRGCQIDAIAGLDASLKRADRRALVQMATGAGKTFTACNLVMRLLAHAEAKRVLFLVDRKNLSTQTKNEFQRFQPHGAGKLFTEIYNVQLLSGRHVEPSSAVVVSTIQRLYAALRGEDIDEEFDEKSAFEIAPDPERPVVYNPEIPIETFDVIIVDECHRSIYGVWRQVLDYFDAFVIGLTATPSKHTLGYFNQNIVAEYPYERSVADGVNVGYEIFRIRTRIGEHGGLIEAGYSVPARDRKTRRLRYQELEDDLAYSKQDLDRSVLAPNQIRTVLTAYRDALFTQLFPGRTEVPKTLIFAKDDHHAEEIVTIAREVFAKGNDFAKKITYRVTGATPAELIKEFQTAYNPRIAVTVDMIATGTDIKPVEAVMFLRDVKSELYYEQMKGRGVRTIAATDLRQVTPDAQTKDRFVLIDAVGVTESAKSASQPLERNHTVAFDKLLEQIAAGQRSDDALSSLAGRLSILAGKLPPDDQKRVQQLAGKDLHQIARTLLDAIDPDMIEADARRRGADAPDGLAKTAAELKETAARTFDDPKLRRLLIELKQQSEIVIDEISTDEVLSADYDLKRADETIAKFRDFLAQSKDELTALQVLYARPYAVRRLTYQAVKDLADAMARPPRLLLPPQVWASYKRLDRAKVRDAAPERLLTDVVALVRFALGQTESLEPFSVDVERRFNLWLGREKNAGRDYTDEQMRWLKLIKEHVAANAEITVADLQDTPAFTDQGGRIAAARAFGAKRIAALLDELSNALVA